MVPVQIFGQTTSAAFYPGGPVLSPSAPGPSQHVFQQEMARYYHKSADKTSPARPSRSPSPKKKAGAGKPAAPAPLPHPMEVVDIAIVLGRVTIPSGKAPKLISIDVRILPLIIRAHNLTGGLGQGIHGDLVRLDAHIGESALKIKMIATMWPAWKAWSRGVTLTLADTTIRSPSHTTPYTGEHDVIYSLFLKADRGTGASRFDGKKSECLYLTVSQEIYQRAEVQRKAQVEVPRLLANDTSEAISEEEDSGDLSHHVSSAPFALAIAGLTCLSRSIMQSPSLRPTLLLVLSR
jgi:hypothetical protein